MTDRRELRERIARIVAEHCHRCGWSVEECLPTTDRILAEIETTHVLAPKVESDAIFQHAHVEHVVEIAAKALYYEIGNAYETEQSWEDLGPYEAAPYMETAGVMLTRLKERGVEILAPHGAAASDTSETP